MNFISKLILIALTLLLISACDNVDRFSILKKCTVLGDESIVYARAHYVKLFHQFNPNKFEEPYKQIGDFDAVTLRNTIDTYTRAIEKIEADNKGLDDPITQKLLSTCKSLAKFSTHFVEDIYPEAIKYKSTNDPLTDDFFIEINQIVKFDHEIGAFDKRDTSFKQNVDRYKNAVLEYINQHRKNIPSEFANQRIYKSK